MKRFLALLVVLVSMGLLMACGTMQATPDQEKSLTKVQEFPGMKKAELFNKSVQFLARTYNSANDVIQLKDPETGTIICKGMGSFYSMVVLNQCYFSYTFIIDVKDAKIRTRFENIHTESVGNSGAADVNYFWDSIVEKLSEVQSGLFASITTAKATDNW